jgi:hypothetical protein
MPPFSIARTAPLLRIAAGLADRERHRRDLMARCFIGEQIGEAWRRREIDDERRERGLAFSRAAAARCRGDQRRDVELITERNKLVRMLGVGRAARYTIDLQEIVERRHDQPSRSGGHQSGSGASRGGRVTHVWW